MGDYRVKVSTVSFGERVELVVGTVTAATRETAERIMARQHPPMTGWSGPRLEEVATVDVRCGAAVSYRGERYVSRGSARAGVLTIARADNPRVWRVVPVSEVAPVGAAA